MSLSPSFKPLLCGLHPQRGSRLVVARPLPQSRLRVPSFQSNEKKRGSFLVALAEVLRFADSCHVMPLSQSHGLGECRVVICLPLVTCSNPDHWSESGRVGLLGKRHSNDWGKPTAHGLRILGCVAWAVGLLDRSRRGSLIVHLKSM